MDEQPSQHTWRDPNSETSKKKKHGIVHRLAQSPVELRKEEIRRRVLKNVYPKKTMQMKSAVLSDLVSQFKKDRIDDSEAQIKDRFNFKSNNVNRTRYTPDEMKFKRLLKQLGKKVKEHDPMIRELVNEVSSTKFKITADPKTDYNVAHGVSTMSCYDNIPREPKVDTEDGNSLESRPDVTKNLDSVYCTNVITRQLNESLDKFLTELSRLQKNLYNRDNVKGRFKRRYYAGFKEINRRLQLKKIKFVMIAPDIDKNKDNGKLVNLVHRFIDSCKKYEIPVIFGLTRRKLGYFIHGKGFVSCIGVANYEALEEKLEDALKKVLEAKNEFKTLHGEPEKTVDIKKILTDDLLVSERVKVLLKTLIY